MKELLFNKTTFLILGMIFIVPGIFLAQENWVKNGDLEEYVLCPNKNNNVYQAKDWWDFDIGGSPEYANACAYNTFNISLHSVPNQAGYQLPKSGNGFIHSIVLGLEKPSTYIFWAVPKQQFRESFGGSFIRPLEKGIYKVEFYINFAKFGKTGSSPDGRVAVNAFDMLLLNDSSKINNSVAPYIDLKDVIKVNNSNIIINDTLNWVKVSTCFQTEGGASFFAIGAFRDTNEILLEFSGYSDFNQYYAFYFFDDFSVVKCDTCCFGAFPFEDHINVSSNPGTSFAPTKFEILLQPNSTATLDFYDYAGKLIARNTFSEMLTTYTLPPLAEGVYHYVFNSSNGSQQNGKVVVYK